MTYQTVPGPPLSTADVYRQRAQIFTGLAPDAPFQFDEFATAAGAASLFGWQASAAGTGAVSTAPNSDSGGVATFSSGATAASSILALSNSPIIGARKTTQWYHAFRAKVTTAIDAQATVAMGLHDIAGVGATTMVGVFGANSTVNFVAQFDGNRTGTFLSTGVAIDTAFHVFEMYCLGDGVLRVRVDGGAEVSAAMVNAVAGPSDLEPFVGNGSTAANRAMILDWSLAVGGRA